MAGKTELTIIALVLIGIIVSGGAMYYSFTIIGDISTLMTQVSDLTDALQTTLKSMEATLTVGTTDSVELTLDPAQAYDYFGWNIMQQIGGTLVAVSPGSATGADFIPELATNWTVSSDLKTWNFTLRQGVLFSDGTEFNATHVKYSFDRAIGLINQIPEGAPAGLGYDLIFDHIDVVSKYVVSFVLKIPFSPFLGILSARCSAIVNPNYAPVNEQVNYTAGDARASTPLAFLGPYNLTEWDRVAGKDQEIRLDANPNYWDLASGYPRIKHIVFKFYSDATALGLAISAGDVDMAFRQIAPRDVLNLETNPNVKVWYGTGAQIQYMCFQANHAPFNDTRARMAVAAALNRTDVTQTVFLGLASPLYSIIPPGMLGHTEAFAKLGDANYTLTRSLLAELGYNETNKLTFDLWYESSGHYPQSEQQALLYKQALEASDVISVTIKPAQWASYKQNRDSEIMDVFVYGWYPDYVDPDDYAFLYWAKWLHINYYNETLSGLPNPSYSAYLEQVGLYDEARATTDSVLRTNLYAQIDDIAVNQCSVIPLWVSGAWAVTKPNIYGVYLDVTQDMRYWLIYK
jgi:peptide/nickel transport system substrate-binding protein